jgi:pimeloyl-ACP methyl ester carboxylesterase
MPTLILIPGLLCDRELWSAQIAALEKCADIVVADITQQPGIPEMAKEILANAPERFSLAGFSLGSQVALDVVTTARGRVDRVALLSATRGGLLPATAEAIRKAIAEVEAGGFDRYLEEAYPTYFAPARVEAAECKRVFVEMAHRVGAQAGLRQMQALSGISAPFAGLNEIKCPTLIVGGMQDRRTTPAAHRALAQEIPASELVLIDGAAHFTMLEKPVEVTQALERWMRR